jgi:WD40 repeat protein
VVSSADSGTEVCIYDADDKLKPLKEIYFDGTGQTVAWAPNGSQFAVLDDCWLSLYDADGMETDGMQMPWCLAFPYFPLPHMSWHPGGRYILISYQDTDEMGHVAIADLQGGFVGSWLGGDAFNVAWSPNGSKIAVALMNGSVRIYDSSTLDFEYQFQAHGSWVDGLAWSHNGQRIATGGDDPELAVWKVTYE